VFCKPLKQLFNRLHSIALKESIMKKTVLNSAIASAIGLAALFSGNAQAALVITAVVVTPPTVSSSGLITVTGDCVVGGGNTTLSIKPQGSGPTWTLLGAGAGNCNKPGPKTKTVKYNQPPGNYKIRLSQGTNIFTWAPVVVLP
jgi:hypothetical protein